MRPSTRSTQERCSMGHGARRAVAGAGRVVNKQRVAWPMQVMGLAAILPKRKTSVAAPGLQQGVSASAGVGREDRAANQVWSTDITFPMPQGLRIWWRWRTAAAALYCMMSRPRRWGVSARRGSGEGTWSGRPECPNTDQGAQFTSSAFTGGCRERSGSGGWAARPGSGQHFVERLRRSAGTGGVLEGVRDGGVGHHESGAYLQL